MRRLLAPARTPRFTSESTAPGCSPLSSLVSAIVGFEKPFFEKSRRKLRDRTSEDGSVEARSKRRQMQLGRPAAADSFGRHLNSNACAFRQANFLCQRRCEAYHRAFLTICRGYDPSFISKCRLEVNTRLNERIGRASINRRARQSSY